MTDLHGIIPPLVLPMTPDGASDTGAARLAPLAADEQAHLEAAAAPT